MAGRLLLTILAPFSVVSVQEDTAVTQSRTDFPTREQRNECRNAILDTWGQAEYRAVFEHVNPFQLIKALDDAIEAVWQAANSA